MTENEEIRPDGPAETAQKEDAGIKHAWNVTKWIAKDSSFRSFMAQFRGTWKSGRLIAQAVAGVIYLLSLPLIIQPIGVVACCAMAAVGLYGLRYGLASAWNSLEKLCGKIMPGSINPMKRIRMRAQKIAKRVSETSLVESLQSRLNRLTDKVAQNPRFIKISEKPLVQKFLNSRLRGCRQARPDAKAAGSFSGRHDRAGIAGGDCHLRRGPAAPYRRRARDSGRGNHSIYSIREYGGPFPRGAKPGQIFPRP